jgi:hypothetical protein
MFNEVPASCAASGALLGRALCGIEREWGGVSRLAWARHGEGQEVSPQYQIQHCNFGCYFKTLLSLFGGHPALTKFPHTCIKFFSYGLISIDLLEQGPVFGIVFSSRS